MERYKFSVLMTVYIKEVVSNFKCAMDSVLHQTLLPDEIVLVVDGPVYKELEKCIKDYKKLVTIPFQIKWLPQNRGQGYATGVGMKMCSYSYVARMDSDDIALPTRFEMQMEYLKKHPDISVLGGQITEFIGKENNIIGKRVVPIKQNDIERYLKRRCPFNQVTVILNKSDVIRAGNYQDFHCNEDYFLWLRMYLNGCKFANLPDVLVNVRVGQEMYQRRGGWIYFKNELKIQNFMLKNHIIGRMNWVINVLIRFIVQCILPNRVRGFFYKVFARERE